MVDAEQPASFTDTMRQQLTDHLARLAEQDQELTEQINRAQQGRQTIANDTKLIRNALKELDK